MFRITLILLAVAVSLVAQFHAVKVLWVGARIADTLAHMFAWQSVAALAGACWLALLLGPHWPRDRFRIAVHAFAICLMAPLAGFLVLLCVIASYRLPARQYIESSAQSLDMPRYSTRNDSVDDTCAPSGQLIDGQAATLEQRLGELIAMQSLLPTGLATLLRHRLADPDEQVRLLAYGVLEKTENAIGQRIAQMQARLKNCSQPLEQARLHGALAELHAEYIRLGHRQNTDLMDTSSEFQSHAYAALKAEEDNVLMYHLVGRYAYD